MQSYFYRQSSLLILLGNKLSTNSLINYHYDLKSKKWSYICKYTSIVFYAIFGAWIYDAQPYPNHTNLSKITLRPWGAKEFALRDNQLGVIIQQW